MTLPCSPDLHGRAEMPQIPWMSCQSYDQPCGEGIDKPALNGRETRRQQLVSRFMLKQQHKFSVVGKCLKSLSEL